MFLMIIVDMREPTEYMSGLNVLPEGCGLRS